MRHNLFVCFSLHPPAYHQDKVTNTIKDLGSWVQIHPSLWYVKSTNTALQASEKIRGVMNPKDALLVVDSTSNFAAWYNLNRGVSDFLKNNWYNAAGAFLSSKNDGVAEIAKCKKTKADGRKLEARDFLLLELYQKTNQLVDEFMDSPELKKGLIRSRNVIWETLSHGGFIFGHSHDAYESVDTNEWVSLESPDQPLGDKLE